MPRLGSRVRIPSPAPISSKEIRALERPFGAVLLLTRPLAEKCKHYVSSLAKAWCGPSASRRACGRLVAPRLSAYTVVVGRLHALTGEVSSLWLWPTCGEIYLLALWTWSRPSRPQGGMTPSAEKAQGGCLASSNPARATETALSVATAGTPIVFRRPICCEGSQYPILAIGRTDHSLVGRIARRRRNRRKMISAVPAWSAN